MPYVAAVCDSCRLAYLVLDATVGDRCDACHRFLRVTSQRGFHGNEASAFAELARAVRSSQLTTEQCQILLAALALLDDTEQARREELRALSRVLPSLTLARVAARGDGAALAATLRLAAEVLKARISLPSRLPR